MVLYVVPEKLVNYFIVDGSEKKKTHLEINDEKCNKMQLWKINANVYVD